MYTKSANEVKLGETQICIQYNRKRNTTNTEKLFGNCEIITVNLFFEAENCKFQILKFLLSLEIFVNIKRLSKPGIFNDLYTVTVRRKT